MLNANADSHASRTTIFANMHRSNRSVCASWNCAKFLPPKRGKPICWLQYTIEAVPDVAAAERIIHYYELQWTIEDFHKCWKTGCAIESRRYETSAKDTSDQPASDIALRHWVDMLAVVRKRKLTTPMTIREFVRALAGLGGFIGRKADGDPGWITLWRGYEKLQLILRGASIAKKCG